MIRTISHFSGIMHLFTSLFYLCWTIYKAFLLIICVKSLYTIARECYAYFVGGLTLGTRLRKYGTWAVVTGCTRGMGLDYCKQLAALKMNLILIARNKALVQKLAEELESEFKISTCVVICDFNDVSEQNFKAVFQNLADKDIGILINNAGVMYEYPEFFHNISDQMLTQMANVNVIWPTRLSHYVVREKMIKKENGLVVFMSSGAGQRATPLLAAYGASKAFIYYLATCLTVECESYGVHVQVISPFYVATDMTKYSEFLNKPSILTPSSETYVKHALKTFGMISDTAGYLPHAVQGALFDMFPKPLYAVGALLWQKTLRDKSA